MIQGKVAGADERESEPRSIPGTEYNIARHGFIELSKHLNMIGEPVCN
jgi:hypothetical protein